MITYSELISHVQPFFLSRWWDSLAWPDRILFYANCSIQDAYNIDSATFTYKNETIDFKNNWATNKFETLNWIRKVQECIWYFANWWSIGLTPTLLLTVENCNDWVKFETWSNILITSTDIVKVEVTYIKEYKWAKYPADMTTVVPLPERYVPAVVKMMMDWASPVNLMTWEWSAIDFFSHAMTRFNKLADDDALTDFYKLNR